MQRAAGPADRLLSRLPATPDVWVHNYDPVPDALLLLEWSAARYRAASFLDDRALGPDVSGGWVRRGRVMDALANVSCARPLHFIFHTGHVGSTLVSRLLESCGALLALREPMALRTLADQFDVMDRAESLLAPPVLQALTQGLLAAWGRGYADTAAVLVKATSSAGRIAPALLQQASAARAIYVNLRAEPGLASLLAGANSLLDLRAHGPARIRRLNGCLGSPVSALHTLTAGELAALSWLTETLSQQRACAAFPERVQSLDFDAFLADVPMALGSLWAHLSLPGTPRIDPASLSMELGRYSKAPDRPYSPELRSQLLQEARRTHAAEIGRGLRWLETLAQREPLVAAALHA